MNKVLNFPNILTISRIALIPAIATAFYMNYSTIVFIVFAFCCLTDFLDGYIARAYKQTTRFGQVLDPISDKALIATTIIFIVWFHEISMLSMIPASLILCREVMVSEVRGIVISEKKKFKTTKIAKWKTTFQMLSLGFITFSRIFDYNGVIVITGEVFLWIASVMAIVSGASYYRRHFDFFL
ncbi:MAG: CDP-diacylglycerol--glycerol-3-phosphate 3-phosphatidyltransferase [Holosporales bacterium]|jgi:CDP-diacylglycerol--glycerol-3-phosphate 3-phosphatidyltransferase|nr:CDP-diacylglycerol--glycerol-3-phosphate 3-phosphatidyltransferase [Holosporales bacterium]